MKVEGQQAHHPRAFGARTALQTEQTPQAADSQTVVSHPQAWAHEVPLNNPKPNTNALSCVLGYSEGLVNKQCFPTAGNTSETAA